MIEADYLIVGSGASGLAFADIIATRSDRTMVIVDRHDRPGGHWNDAYRFVRLHQPSAFYGVDSLELSDGKVDFEGPNRGMLSLASGAEVSAYFERVMAERLLPTGRVTYLPNHEVDADGGTIHPIFGGDPVEVRARRIVDSTYYDTAVPSTTPPSYAIAPGTRLATPNDLPDLWRARSNVPPSYCIIGAGKTATDSAGWLLNAGIEPAAIYWIRPRDSWFYNRARFQTGVDCAADVLAGQVALMEAFASARDSDDLFEQLEAADYMLRIDPDVRPTMFHYATCSKSEVARLRAIRGVIRQGRVARIAPDNVSFEGGMDVALPDGTLFIDCTARAIAPRPPVPVWQDGRITIQMVRAAQPAFSAALIAYLDLALADESVRNAVTRPIPLPASAAGFAFSTLVNLSNQQAWMQHDDIRPFVLSTRLDGFSASFASYAESSPTGAAQVARLRTVSRDALPNIRRLASGGPG